MEKLPTQNDLGYGKSFTQSKFASDNHGTISCCNKKKVLTITVETPQGEQTFHVCEKHRNLEYFKKYKISEETIQ